MRFARCGTRTRVALCIAVTAAAAALLLAAGAARADDNTGLSAAALTADGVMMSASVWTCFGPILSGSNCPYGVVDGHELFLDSAGGSPYASSSTGHGVGALVADTDRPNSGYVFAMSWTYGCWYNPRPNTYNALQTFNFGNDFDPYLCPVNSGCTSGDPGCPPQGAWVLPGVTCPSVLYVPAQAGYVTTTLYDMCPEVRTQGQGTAGWMDWSVNGTGLWLSAFNAQDTSRAWRVRADQQFTTRVSGQNATCAGVVKMHVVGSVLLVQCKLFVAQTATLLQSTLLVAVNKFDGALLWTKYLPQDPVFTGTGQGTWLTPVPGATRGASSFVNNMVVTGGSTIGSALQQVTPFNSFLPRWCAQACLYYPSCTAWTYKSGGQYADYDLCQLYSGATSLTAPSDGNFIVSGLITAQRDTGQHCGSFGGACVPYFRLNDGFNYVFTQTGCNAQQSEYFAGAAFSGTTQYCCTTPTCTLDPGGGASLCHGGCTTCAPVAQHSANPSRVLVHRALGLVFVPDLNGGAGSVALDARNGGVVHTYNAVNGGATSQPQWASYAYNSTTCFGASDYNADAVNTPPIVHTLVDGVTTLMIGQAADAPGTLVATDVATGTNAWSFTIPPLVTNGYPDTNRVIPFFVGAGASVADTSSAGGGTPALSDLLYYVSYWMGTSAPCNVVVFAITRTSLTYINRFPVDNSLCTTSFSAGGGVEPFSGRFFFAGATTVSGSVTSVYTYDAVAQRISVLSPWPADPSYYGYYNPQLAFWKPISATVTLFGVNAGNSYGTGGSIVMTQLLLCDLTQGGVLLSNVTGNSPNNAMSYLSGAAVANDSALLVVTGNPVSGDVLQRYTPSVVVDLSVGEAARVAVIVLMVLSSVLNAFVTCIKARQFAEAHASKLPASWANVLLGDDAHSRYGSNSDSSAIKRLDGPNIVLTIAVSATVMIASAVQQSDVVTQLDAWRGTFGSFQQFAAAHIRPNGSPASATYNVDVCTCTTGPCGSNAQYLQTCGITSQSDCGAEITSNGACALTLFGYTCACSASIDGCSITAQPTGNVTNAGIAQAISTGSPPFVAGVSDGYDTCVGHYDDVQQKLHTNLVAIVVVGCISILFDLARAVCLFCWRDGFEIVSSVSSVVGFGSTIATGVLTAQVTAISLASDYCTSAGGPLVQPLAGCAYVNLGVVASAEALLVKRMTQCVLIFVAKPVALGLHAAFTALQQLPHFGCCKCCA